MLEPGRVLGRRYEILEQIGSGGMAYVYKAKDYKLNRLVAIKVLKQEFAMDETILDKFRKEALAAGGLNHPSIVSVYDMGHEIGNDYIVMEYIDGITLKEYIRRRDGLSSEEIIKISLRIAEALKSAHASGIIHRDIKPQNIMVTPQGEVKVTDFGIAKATTQKTMTATGETLGSVHYLSPEQARGEEVDNRSDLYSLGITMYEMATKELPFTADTAVAVAMKQVHDPFPNPKLKAPDLWPGLCDIIIKLTQKSLDRRYISADDLIRDLRQLYKDHEYRVISAHTSGQQQEEKLQRMRSQQMKERQRIQQEREEKKRREKRRRRNILLVSVLSLLLLIGIAYLMSQLFKNPGGESSSVPESSQSTPESTSSSSSIIEREKVPDFTGLTYEQAVNAGRDAQIRFDVKTQADSSVEAGIIVDQSPAQGEDLPEDRKVILYVSLGPQTSYTSVPSLAGKTESEAREALEAVGLILGEISLAYNETVEEGKVINQGIAAGEEVEEGTQVEVTISLGKENSQEESSQTGGSVTVQQPFTQENQTGILRVVAYDAAGSGTSIYHNSVSYTMFQSLGGYMKINYPAGTIRVEVYLDDEQISSEQVS